ncbi:helix-turn-helix transcriptional regulator [Trebonia sp.]|uniref:helix-turn-helix domain-containing protein n=1 Tax=Trebonia sp. TaxID=2767075 RepID=UPI002609AE7D|nr:helix-turn-helix transcriptional regulator [Trebonia sp.]
MSQSLGAWLRQERETRGWDRIEMAKRLIAAGQARGDKHMPGLSGMCHNVYRWERGGYGVSERHMLSYCAVFGIPPARFPRQADGQAEAGGRPGIQVPAPLSHATVDAHTPGPAGMSVRPGREPETGDRTAAGLEVLMAAHEGSERAEQAEQRGIGDATVEQLRADVTRLSRDYMSCEPLPLFREMRRVRSRMHGALDRRIWPRDAKEIYFLLGCVNGLMAGVADDLGYPGAAQELYRAGWAYATAIGQRALLAKLRLGLASLAYWNGQFQQAAELASNGLEYLAAGPTGVQLHLTYGRAAARMGDVAAARQAITAAGQASDQAYADDLTIIGGEYDLSRATRHYLVASVLIEIPAAGEAPAELERAGELYAAGPGPGETHGYAMEALARVSLAEARLRCGALDAVSDALEPVLVLPPGKRIDLIPQRLGRVRAQLALHPDHGSALLRDLDDRIAEFSSTSIAAPAELSALSA